ENAERLGDVGARRPFGEIARSAERRQLLGDCNVDQLVERNAFRLGQLARLFEQGGLQPQREIALSHLPFSNRLNASPGNRGTIPNSLSVSAKSRRLNVTIQSARPFTAVSNTMSSLIYGSNGRQRNAKPLRLRYSCERLQTRA